MSSKDVPDQWAARMIERGFTDGRGSGRPSMSALARKIGVHTSTISAAIHGERSPSAGVVADIAQELGADTARWLGREYHGPWEPPNAASLLTERQRKALDELINSMTERQEISHAQDQAPNTRDGGSPSDDLAAKREEQESIQRALDRDAARRGKTDRPGSDQSPDEGSDETP